MTNDLPEQPTTPPLPDTPPPPAEPPAASATEAPRKKPGPLVAGLTGLALGAGIVGGIWAIVANSGPDRPPTFTLKGTFTLTEDAISTGDDDCSASYDSGYDDIAEGTSVTVYGAKGDVIATGELGDSTYADYACLFDIAVPDVPKGEKFYKIEVSHRGTLQLSAKEAENGELTASLG
ncbi:hypothetical protein [Streptomyces sp. NPDC055013]